MRIPNAVHDAPSSKAREVVIAWTGALLGVVLGGCVTRQGTRDDVPIPNVSIVPPCDDSGSRVDLLDCRPDPVRHKPSSLGMKRVLADLRIRTGGLDDLWMMVGKEAFPSVVREVSRMEDGSWLFSGNEMVFARWIGRSADVAIKDVELTTSGRKLPVLLGLIRVDGMSPQRWVEQGGHGDHRKTLGEEVVEAGLAVVCATWFDMRPRVELSHGL